MPDPGGHGWWRRADPSSVGADDGTRTRRRFTKPLLYQLSYVGATHKDTRRAARTQCTMLPAVPPDPQAVQRARPGCTPSQGPRPWNCPSGGDRATRAAARPGIPPRKRPTRRASAGPAAAVAEAVSVERPAGGAASDGWTALGRKAWRRRSRLRPSATAIRRPGSPPRPDRVAPSGASASRWPGASNRSTDPATAALSEPIRPRIGIRTTRSQRRRTADPSPSPSLPTTRASGPRRSASR